MTTTTSALADPIKFAARAVLQTVFAHLRPREFAVELWDGEQWPPEPNGPPDFKLIFRTPNVVRSIFSDASSLSFGEAYIHGELDIEGPLIDVFESGDRLLAIHYPPSEKLRLARWLWSIPAPKYSRSGIFSGFPRRLTPTTVRIRDAVNYHYNHPVDFWKLWLDESLCYSCAYFAAPEHWLSRLDAAQSEIERQTDPLSFRVFRLYLAGSAYEFRCGPLNIYQTLLAKPERGQSGLPLTRTDWHQSSQAD